MERVEDDPDAPLSRRAFKEVSLNGNNWVRQIHSWLSIAFAVAVIVNIVALGWEDRAVWVGILARVPLALLLFTGLYLFVLPRAATWRNGRRGKGDKRPGEGQAT